MKVSKNGKIRLDANEKRIGNFVLRRDDGYMKLCDVSRLFIYSVSVETPAGMYLAMSYDSFKDEETSRGIVNYIAVLWSLFATVPDVQFLGEVYGSCVSCMERHTDCYGIPSAPVSDEADAAILEEQKGLCEAAQELDTLIRKEIKDGSSHAD